MRFSLNFECFLHRISIIKAVMKISCVSLFCPCMEINCRRASGLSFIQKSKFGKIVLLNSCSCLIQARMGTKHFLLQRRRWQRAAARARGGGNSYGSGGDGSRGSNSGGVSGGGSGFAEYGQRRTVNCFFFAATQPATTITHLPMQHLRRGSQNFFLLPINHNSLELPHSPSRPVLPHQARGVAKEGADIRPNVCDPTCDH